VLASRDVPILVCCVRDGICLAVVTDILEGALRHFSCVIGFRTQDLQLAGLLHLGSVATLESAKLTEYSLLRITNLSTAFVHHLTHIPEELCPKCFGVGVRHTESLDFRTLSNVRDSKY
jgi:hypothetical protein